MENNKLIAEFMGVPCDKDLYTPLCPHTGETLFIPISQMKYDTLWDWLIPVVQKCFDAQEPTEGQHYFINESLLTIDIEVVYDRIVSFIKDYNFVKNYNDGQG